MDKAELAKLLRATFAQELRDHVETLTRELLAMESDQPPGDQSESWATVFRVAHTLKGASAIVGIDSVRDACHAMEEVFGHYRDHQIWLPETLTSLLLQVVDAFDEIGSQLPAKPDPDDAQLRSLLPLLQQQARQLCEAVPCDRAAAGTPRQQIETPARAETAERPPAERNPQAAQRGRQSETARDGWSSPVARDTDNPAATGTSASDSPAPPPPPLATPVSRPAVSIRVAAEKLDSLLTYSGELLTARGRMAMRVKDLHELADRVAALKADWTRLPRSLPAGPTTTAGDDKLDALLHSTGDGVLDLTRRIERLAASMASDDRLLKQTCQRLDDELYRVRMLPFDEACVGLERVVRDVAKAGGKDVQLVIEGGDVEVDRSVLEGLKDPLLHLIRNAVDHGVEAPDERAAAGKPRAATVTVSAALRGGQVEVVVADDGRGFDLERIRAIAAQRGLEVPEDPRAQARLVLSPGFSTAGVVTAVSGRGIGMDVVQSRVESLHGELNIAFAVGQGTRFTLLVPLTLTTIRCTLVRVRDAVYAMPTAAIERLVRFEDADVQPAGGRDMLLVQGQPIRLVPLAETLGQSGKPRRQSGTRKSLALILSADQQQVAAVVDEVLTEQEALVKNLGRRIRRLRHFSGCTLLPSGSIALVVNAANVVRSALETPAAGSIATSSRPQQRTQKRILLADDSVTTRILLKNILETAGYSVIEAVDGVDAWNRLSAAGDGGAGDFDAIVSDVDMPGMDGFALTAQVRASSSFAELPIILVTARGSDQDKEKGVRAGATAYIAKGSFDQQYLLQTLSQLV